MEIFVSAKGLDLGRRIMDARLARAITQRQLALAAGVCDSQITHIEKGHNGASWETLIAIDRALGTYIAADVVSKLQTLVDVETGGINET